MRRGAPTWSQHVAADTVGTVSHSEAVIAAWRSRGPPPKFNDGRDTLGVRGRTCDTQTASSDSQGSPYLSFVVALHVATALALDFYRKDWVRIVAAFVSSIRARRIDTPTEHLAWLLVVATVPVGLIGLVLEQPFRIWLAKRWLPQPS